MCGEGWSGAEVLIVWSLSFRVLPFLFAFAVGGLALSFARSFVGCSHASRSERPLFLFCNDPFHALCGVPNGTFHTVDKAFSSHFIL